MVAGISGLSGAVRGSLAAILGEGVSFDEPLARHCSFGVGGPADAFCDVGQLSVLRRLLDVLAAHEVRWIVLGRGTNVIPSDRGLRGVAIRLEGEFGHVEVHGRCLEAGAAAALSLLVERAATRELGGLEFTAGIPGCVGGSLPGNSGTASESLGDRVEEVEILEPGGAARTLHAMDMRFSYRNSSLRNCGGIITRAHFRMESRPRAEVMQRVREYAERRKSQPLAHPNAGCIFKNPPGHPAGKLIDEAGLKGFRSGGAEVSPMHANFMVNMGGATAADVAELIGRVREKVLSKTGVLLETEIVLLDELGRPAC